MKFGLIGEKLGHSISPLIHKQIYNTLNINAEYNLYEMTRSDVKNLSRFMEDYELRGVNVTVPYKTDVLEICSALSEEASGIGAVNTVLNTDGLLNGYNTDYYGFKRTVELIGISQPGICTVLGSGGAAKSIIRYLLDNNASEVYTVSRNPCKQEKIKGVQVISYNDLNNIGGQLIINATPVGMYPDNDSCPVSVSVLKNYKFAVDVIYNPLKTEFIRRSESLGLKCSSGLAMLVYQAIKSDEIWLDIKIDNGIADKIISMCKKYLTQNFSK